MKTSLCALAILAALASCGPPEGKTAAPKPAPPPRQAVQLEGTATNGKSGATLQTADKSVEIQGLAAWPADVVGKRLTLKGELQTVPPPPATMDPMGSAVQTILTTRYVLHGHSKVEPGAGK